jgi:hypothetical protein
MLIFQHIDTKSLVSAAKKFSSASMPTTREFVGNSLKDLNPAGKAAFPALQTIFL